MTPQDLIKAMRERSKELKDKRLKSGLSIEELSKLSGLSDQTIYRMESGEQGWRMESEALYLHALEGFSEENPLSVKQ